MPFVPPRILKQFFVRFSIISIAQSAIVKVLNPGFTNPVTMKFLLRMSLILLARPPLWRHQQWLTKVFTVTVTVIVTVTVTLNVFWALALHPLLILLSIITLSVSFSLLLICTTVGTSEVSLYAVKPFTVTGILFNCSLSLLNEISCSEAVALNFLVLSNTTPFAILCWGCAFDARCGRFSVSGVVWFVDICRLCNVSIWLYVNIADTLDCEPQFSVSLNDVLKPETSYWILINLTYVHDYTLP